MVAIFDTQTTSPRKVSFLTQGCPTLELSERHPRTTNE